MASGNSDLGLVPSEEDDRQTLLEMEDTNKEECGFESSDTENTNSTMRDTEVDTMNNEKSKRRDQIDDPGIHIAEKCEPCQYRNISISAIKSCQECDEKYCEPCALSHARQKQTKSHTLQDIQKEISTSQNCEPCVFKGKYIEALYICKSCDEHLCEDCRMFHLVQKSNKDHTIREITTVTQQINCETCVARGCDDKVATAYCLDCQEPEAFCDFCAEQHTAMKISRNHKFSPDMQTYLSRSRDYKKPSSDVTVDSQYKRDNVDFQNNKSHSTGGDTKLTEVTESENASQIRAVLLCEPCTYQDLNETASHFCLNCDERYCENCTKRHKSHKRTSDHILFNLAELKQMCDSCKYNDEEREATHMCVECDEGLCNDCMKYHRSQKQTRHHKLNLIQKKEFCESCLSNDQHVQAISFCLDCDEPELFCSPCAKHHTSMKQTRNHRFSERLDEFAILILKRNATHSLTKETNEPIQTEEINRPGKPYVTESNMANQLIVKWEDAQLIGNDAYQLIYKDVATGKWKTCRYNSVKSTFKLDGLQPQTSYIFRVRVVNDESGEEGPFSQDSNIITTGESKAKGMMKISNKIYDKPIAVYALPIKEVKLSRNARAKTRKMVLGNPTGELMEKNVMIVGATGSGKSTLINAMANYIMGVTWEDPFRFTLVNVETSEMTHAGNQAHSQTEWITCYTIYTSVSSRLKYSINLIDTPGFGDTRGLEHDKRIVDQIRELFTAQGIKGVTTIDAVCFILKAPDARLTPTQLYIFEEILSLFGNDIQNNICTLVTFADGEKPPVLAGLEALEHKILPHEKYFRFNNSALFTDNRVNDPGSLSPTFWEMGTRSCESFFEHLKTLQTKSLVLTSEVLLQRENLENTIQHLYQQVECGLSKINVLEQEIDIFTKYRRQIRENKNFTYTVIENVQEVIDLTGQRRYTTNCLSCNYTCHENCKYANDEDKIKCSAMGRNGDCKRCPSNCHWSQHKNTPYIIKWVPKEKHKKYSEKQNIYEEASKKSLTQEQILEAMSKDIEKLECAIADCMQRIAKYNNRLKEIALRPDPCSTAQYIDLMIETEKRDKKKGFEARIDALENCKKRVQYGKSVKIFQDRVQTTRKNLEASVLEDDEYAESSLFDAFKNLGMKFIHAFKT